MSYDGPERRHDYPDISQRLVRLEVLQNKDITDAEKWRERFCNKLDKLTDLINGLPCDKREGRWISLGAQIKWLWIAVSFIMTILSGTTLVLMLRFK